MIRPNTNTTCRISMADSLLRDLRDIPRDKIPKAIRDRIRLHMDHKGEEYRCRTVVSTKDSVLQTNGTFKANSISHKMVKFVGQGRNQGMTHRCRNKGKQDRLPSRIKISINIRHNTRHDVQAIRVSKVARLTLDRSNCPRTSTQIHGPIRVYQAMYDLVR